MYALKTKTISMNTNKGSFFDLFNEKYRVITSILWVDWFSNIFIYYGLIFMIPLTLLLMDEGEGKEDLVVLIIVAAAEIPAALICFLLVDRKEFGRKNLMALGYAFEAIILMIGAFILNETYYMF